MNVREFLETRGVNYEHIPHRATFEAQRLAEVVAVSGYEVAKTVLLRVDGAYMLAVLPAPMMVDLDLACENLRAENVQLASEAEFNRIFPDCETGAIPPFGSQYGLKTIVEETLTEDDEIVFQGNTHEDAFRIRFADFQRLEDPLIIRFAAFGPHPI
jgi:Ala-tRNA(Pro) deacylase